MVNKENEYDVIVIGGGATGAGTARDCALRGLRVLREPQAATTDCFTAAPAMR